MGLDNYKVVSNVDRGNGVFPFDLYIKASNEEEAIETAKKHFQNMPALDFCGIRSCDKIDLKDIDGKN